MPDRLKKLYTPIGNAYLSAPGVVNIQLDSYCPLACSFCFMRFSERKTMSIDVLKRHLDELYDMGTKSILFGQGEPMCYLRLYEAVQLAKSYNFRVIIATSGVQCTFNKIRRLRELGLDELHISLNSYDEAQNSKSRDGYAYAISSMKMAALAGLRFAPVYVAQKETIPMFENYVQKSIEMGASAIIVLREKTDRFGGIGQYSRDSLKSLAEVLQKSPIQIQVEECFCELMLIYKKRLPAPLQGCAAGRTMMAITADGRYLPCSHLQSKATITSSISYYWNSQESLGELRDVALTGEPCINCLHLAKCTPCQALYNDIKDAIHDKREFCMMFAARKADS